MKTNYIIFVVVSYSKTRHNSKTFAMSDNF